jgi:hypothetical protein
MIEETFDPRKRVIVPAIDGTPFFSSDVTLGSNRCAGTEGSCRRRRGAKSGKPLCPWICGQFAQARNRCAFPLRGAKRGKARLCPQRHRHPPPNLFMDLEKSKNAG